MTSQNKRFMNKMLKMMKVDEKETFIQQLTRIRIWDEKKVRKEWWDLEKKAKENAKKHQREFAKRTKGVKK